VSGFRFGLDIAVHNFQFSDMVYWIWNEAHEKVSDGIRIAKFPYPYTTAG